jgi:hypothetical protein
MNGIFIVPIFFDFTGPVNSYHQIWILHNVDKHSCPSTYFGFAQYKSLRAAPLCSMPSALCPYTFQNRNNATSAARNTSASMMNKRHSVSP